MIAWLVTTALFCPLCDMETEPSLNLSISGNQSVFACSMGGHLDRLYRQSTDLLGRPESIADAPAPYDLDRIKCPVCGSSTWTSPVQIKWGRHGNQYLFACSKGHADRIKSDPHRYMAAPVQHTDFCTSSAVMLDGFQSTVHGTCVRLWRWTLDSREKYLAALVGLFILAIAVELGGEFRAGTARHLLKCYGRRPSGARQALIANGPMTLPFPARMALGLLYGLHLGAAYGLMLAAMTYETGIFGVIMAGLGTGFFVCRDTEGERMKGNVDPCCST